MIDVKKSYRTRNGMEVINLQYVPFNSSGIKVSFPIKGSVKIPGRPMSYRIWKEDGSHEILKKSEWDLVEDFK